MIVDKKELDFIKNNRPHGMLKVLTKIVNNKYKVDYSEQAIGFHLNKRKRKGNILEVPDLIINECRNLLKELTGKEFKQTI